MKCNECGIALRKDGVGKLIGCDHCDVVFCCSTHANQHYLSVVAERLNTLHREYNATVEHPGYIYAELFAEGLEHFYLSIGTANGTWAADISRGNGLMFNTVDTGIDDTACADVAENLHILLQKWLTEERRLRDVAEKAQLAFWEVVAKEYAEMTSGDFPPDAMLRFDGECLYALRLWRDGNRPHAVNAAQGS